MAEDKKVDGKYGVANPNEGKNGKMVSNKIRYGDR